MESSFFNTRLKTLGSQSLAILYSPNRLVKTPLQLATFVLKQFNETIIWTNLLTYLIGHNNLINGFRPAATHRSRRLYFLRAYANWLHQSMTGLPRFGVSNGYKLVLFADFRRSPHQIPVSPKHHISYERHGRASAAAEY